MIEHGLPKHDYFTIAQPPSVARPTVDLMEPGYQKPRFTLKDPKSNDKIQAELQDIWVFKLDDFEHYNAFSLLAYGIEARKLVKVLCRRYPEIEEKQTVHFLLLKKISNQ